VACVQESKFADVVKLKILLSWLQFIEERTIPHELVRDAIEIFKYVGCFVLELRSIGWVLSEGILVCFD
ncbi:hypothetical protein U1Q18_025060, partial [Sarracenia purpurea var. burkii]